MTKELQNVTRDLKNRDIGKIVEFHVWMLFEHPSKTLQHQTQIHQGLQSLLQLRCYFQWKLLFEFVLKIQNISVVNKNTEQYSKIFLHVNRKSTTPNESHPKMNHL